MQSKNSKGQEDNVRDRQESEATKWDDIWKHTKPDPDKPKTDTRLLDVGGDDGAILSKYGRKKERGTNRKQRCRTSKYGETWHNG